ncbi:hypothetical protein O181_035268 [Austropuccinia psidii MF-1]|uniref:Uncharacterized protein n=1 Tax=Austropuccinia psidii MF-1 TaxID=1389203 RepID=A0A9Q3D744_9BASI|nr:hypothetical protein [Austropuccinia psidii MF-1]
MGSWESLDENPWLMDTDISWTEKGEPWINIQQESNECSECSLPLNPNSFPEISRISLPNIGFDDIFVHESTPKDCFEDIALSKLPGFKLKKLEFLELLTWETTIGIQYLNLQKIIENHCTGELGNFRNGSICKIKKSRQV